MSRFYSIADWMKISIFHVVLYFVKLVPRFLIVVFGSGFNDYFNIDHKDSNEGASGSQSYYQIMTCCLQERCDCDLHNYRTMISYR